MRASIGGIMNMVFIVVFIVIVSSFLLFNVSYSQAYRVKNKIITLYEQYEGNCNSSTTQCQKEIKAYEERLGYKEKKVKNDDSYENCYQELSYCVKKTQRSKNGTKYTIYKIKTEVSVDFPFVRDIFGVGVFDITGETEEIENPS